MKTDPSELFRDADRVESPDLWNQITERHPASGTPTPLRRMAVVVTALMIALAGTLVLVQAFNGAPIQPRPHPAPATQASVPSHIEPHLSGVVPVAGGADFLGSSAVGDGSLWVETLPTTGDGAGAIARIDPSSGHREAEIPLPSGLTTGLVFGYGSLWVEIDANGTAELQRIDPATNAIVATIPVGGGRGGLRSAMVADPTGLWVWSTDESGARVLLRVDPSDNTVAGSIPLGPAPHWGNFGDGELVSAQGWLWALDWNGDLIKIDPRTRSVLDTFPIGGYGMAAGGGNLWIDVQPAGTRRGMLATSYLEQVDADTGAVITKPFPVTSGVPHAADGSASPLAVDGDTLWLNGFSGAQGIVTIDAMDLDTLLIDASVQLPVPQTPGVTFSGDDQRIWASGSQDLIRVDLRAPNLEEATRGAQCDETSGRSTPVYSATSGSPGSTITASGSVPHYQEAGDYVIGSTLQWWWNADTAGDAWARLMPGSTDEPVPAGPGPVLLLAETEPGWACRYETSITIPDAAPGGYGLSALQVGGGGASLLADPVTFTVTG